MLIPHFSPSRKFFVHDASKSYTRIILSREMEINRLEIRLSEYPTMGYPVFFSSAIRYGTAYVYIQYSRGYCKEVVELRVGLGKLNKMLGFSFEFFFFSRC